MQDESIKLEAEFPMTEIITNGEMWDKKNLAGVGVAHFDSWDIDCVYNTAGGGMPNRKSTSRQDLDKHSEWGRMAGYRIEKVYAQDP